jgi:hypothetical protein
MIFPRCVVVCRIRRDYVTDPNKTSTRRHNGGHPIPPCHLSDHPHSNSPTKTEFNNERTTPNENTKQNNLPKVLEHTTKETRTKQQTKTKKTMFDFTCTVIRFRCSVSMFDFRGDFRFSISEIEHRNRTSKSNHCACKIEHRFFCFCLLFCSCFFCCVFQNLW